MIRTGVVLAALLASLALAAPNASLAQAAGGCPLCDAARTGDGGAVALLLEHGANANATDAAGVAPLGYALAARRPDQALLLLKHGATATAKLPDGGSPLSVALDLNDLALAQALVRAGATGDARTLISAAEAGHADMVQLLLDAQADVNATDPDGGSALGLAIVYPQVDEKTGRATDASRANLRAVMPTIRLLLGAGARPDVFAIRKALDWADYDDDNSVLELLLAHGAELDTLRDELPLARVHDEALLRRLVDAGVNPDMEDSHGDTAINHAVSMYDPDQVRRLIDLGADINHQGQDGAPIVQAIKANNAALFDLLLRRGGDLGATLSGDPTTAERYLSSLNNATPAPAISQGVESILDARHAAQDLARRMPQTPHDSDAAPRIPGGFSIGDYQRLGAALSPISADVYAQYVLFAVSLSVTAELAVPEQARDHAARGLDAYAQATRRSELLAAALEFEQAAQAAPWVAGYYRDLCVIDHLAGAYARALLYCGVYKLATPPDGSAIDAIVTDSQAHVKALRKLENAPPAAP